MKSNTYSSFFTIKEKMDMTIQPNFNTHEYDPVKVIRVRNLEKQKLYISLGMYPCDIYVDSNGELVMLFEKSTFT